ncbi:hypothetical protein E4J89_16395 [Arthrobacter sp. CAU 1506]|uniref:hypothetical protein n=1 Tax=Arthrobacter sp. CAU 1506 TaxID=2560052 RepID=UPI0010AD47F3|nr:hypothetical protein [Arthrobacter sp. CAU 1506]TJY66344.1 hypothetical protein E4J89_16395 [Arthrobacter sp. CAU 1506]
MTTSDIQEHLPAARNRFIERVPLITAVAAGCYSLAAVFFLLTQGSLPLVPAEALSHELNGPLGTVLSYVLLSLAMAGCLLGFAVHYRLLPGRASAAGATVFASVYAGIALLAVVDSSILATLGYLPFLAVKSITDPGILQTALDLPWPIVGHQLACILGVALWILTAAVAVRRNSGACVACGRHSSGGAVRRWGTPVTIAAAVIPGVYALTRLAWAAGMPLGIEPAFLQRMQSTGQVYAGLGLAIMALLGVGLTLGLIQRWGSVFPRWIPFVGGRRVPVLLAVIPAGFVSLIAVPAGAEMIRVSTIRGTGGIPFDWANWATIGPTLLWIPWGVLLGAATLAYYLKHRGSCTRCGLSG